MKFNKSLKILTTIVASAWLSIANAAESSTWERLWHNADQRGERLLQAGDAASAAQTYRDPRRKAYAELQAGDFAAAEKDFAALDDSDAHYNRGNALAQSGDLQAALKAYDTALAKDPRNHDAEKNRELIKKALEQQSKQSDQSGQSGKSGADQKGQNGKDQNGQGDQSKGDQSKGDQSKGDQSKDGQSDPGKNGENQNGQSQNGQPDPKNADQQDANQQAKNAQQSQGQSGDQNGDAQNKDDADQARRDAQASLNQQVSKPDAKEAQAQSAAQAGADPQAANKDQDQQQAQQAMAAEKSDKPANGKPTRAIAAEPLTEQQLAQEQWLRSIPDDPGGLLRRKFQIEHMMKQQSQQSQKQP
jgi:Ca-activated chloride channel family protein